MSSIDLFATMLSSRLFPFVYLYVFSSTFIWPIIYSSVALLGLTQTPNPIVDWYSGRLNIYPFLLFLLYIP